MFKLTTYPILLEAGQTRPDFPGFWAASAPRKAARLRGGDQVILFFSQSGSMPLAPNAQREMLNRLAETYFTAGGSVTAGLRAMAERLNDFLLARNVRSARTGGQLIGLVSLGVIHSGMFFLAQAGPVHVYRMNAQAFDHYYDGDGVSRGMGVAKVISLRYYQCALSAGDTLVWSVDEIQDVSQGWRTLGVQDLARRLSGEVLEMQGGLVRLSEGKGEVEALYPPVPVSAPPAAYTPAVEGIYLTGKAATSAPPEEPAGEEPQPAFAEAVEPLLGGSLIPVEIPAVVAPPPEQARPRPQTQPSPPPPLTPEGPSPAAAAAARAAVDGIGRMRKFRDGFSRAMMRLFERALPGRPDQGIYISPGNMLFVAVVVPLLIVAVAMTVYFQRGRGQQHQLFIQSAQYYADQAATVDDLGLRREDWAEALYWLDKAEEFGTSVEADALRDQVQAEIDQVDGILRMSYRPVAEGDLPANAQITRMVSSLNEIYLLDSAQGQVLRLYRSGQGYEYDSQFVCGPGRPGGKVIGPLIDIVPLSLGNPKSASVMAIDSGGNLVFCSPNKAGFDSYALPIPETNWGKISAMELYQGELYILDPQVNSVWRFDPTDDELDFINPPHFYFSAGVPRLSDVVDMAIDQEYLYLLHSDGTMTTCISSGDETECVDPSPFGDGRSGRESSPLRFDDAAFLQIQTTQPPDPSLYVLDTQADSIYHFSLRKLNLQRQYRPQDRPDYPLPGGSPTAFVVTPNRRVLLAFGSQVFFAAMP